MIRHFINSAPRLTLGSSMTASGTLIQVASTAGYPDVPFTLALERGQANEEVVLCTAKTATSFTVSRGYDGGTPVAHAAGVAIEHTSTAADYNEANAHVNEVSSDIHPQYVTKAAWTGKGVVLAATAAGTPAAISGATGQVLVVDSTQASGLKFAQIVASNITDGTITEAKLASAVTKKLVNSVAALPTGAAGDVAYTTSNQRLNFFGAAWAPIAYGIGRVTISSSAPVDGVDGDVWLQVS